AVGDALPDEAHGAVPERGDAELAQGHERGDALDGGALRVPEEGRVGAVLGELEVGDRARGEPLPASPHPRLLHPVRGPPTPAPPGRCRARRGPPRGRPPRLPAGSTEPDSTDGPENSCGAR